VAVVTLSRQYGAGGLRVAPAVAEALGFRLVDRELVDEAARRLGIDPELARDRDERVPALVVELGMALARATPGLIGGEAGLPDDRDLAEATRLVILSLAAAGGYVILGRGAQAVLAGRPDACHLSLVGDLEDRARRVAEWQGLDLEEARARCRRVDAERAAYVRRFYRLDIRDPLLYDCVLNTSRLTLEQAAELAVAVARCRLGL
jgi:cytidylate kinase